MRPLRFILLLTFFVALPVFLTCWSLLSTHDSPAETFRAGYNAETNRLRALFSFSTPSSLFPPSAVISLTNDNSTFFLARPAAFGPSLPTRGLSGQLWVGRGFGDESAFQDDGVHVTGWELGCSDVPGWRDDERKHVGKVAALEKAQKRSIDTSKDGDASDGDIENQAEQSHDDGTDDYLHSPLPDSNPARSGKPGEPANIDPDKSKKATHADIESLQESADIAGKVVLLARGGCGFLEKVKWVQRRGGRAVIVGEREKGGSLTIMYAKGDTSNVTIPAIFTSYNAAHLLSSLVPDKGVALEENARSSTDGKKDKVVDKPVFTSTTASLRPTGLPSKSQPGSSHNEPGWMQDALAAIGLTDNTPWHAEDSRRPPGSGNIEWVLQEDWDDDDHVKTKSNALLRTSSRLATTSTMSTKAQATGLRRAGDDFVIGVQDWRDTELIAPKSTMSSNIKAQNGKVNQVLQSSSPVGAKKPTETALKGGSITPGSGEYDHDQEGKPQDASDASIRSKVPLSKDNDHHDEGRRGWLSLFSSKPCPDPKSHPDRPESKLPSSHSPEKKPHDGTDDQDGLWVTLTPTSVSTSPFFDTLLVLVVSPLVTLTVVYALLLLRSRIRRRRWRAPKSVVERLPVRTYHTTSTTSSTTSSQVSTPDHSAAASPLLQPTTQDVSRRPRPRSQTTTGVVASSQDTASSLPTSLPIEKPRSKASRRKKYTGRQLECVVCLEDYVDGESRVMSLPCGHEFHADCITPWLVNRRRTCPICKGDVVRSMARANRGQHTLDQRQDGEQTSDDVQARAAQTVNEEVSAAIPIPPRDDDSEDEDIERGQEIDEPLLGGRAAGQQSAWRNVIARSLSRLSGDTVWRQTPNDRSR